MQVSVDIGFKDLVDIVKNLPKDQLLQLKRELDNASASKTVKTDFKDLLLNGPTFSDEQIQTMEETRNAINQWRTK